MGPDQSAANKLDRYYVGRFSFFPPEEMRETGRGQNIYHTAVATPSVGPGGVSAYWNERLAEIRTISPPQGHDTALLRTFELSHRVGAIWYINDGNFPGILTIEAVRPLDGHVLVASREADAGKEHVAEELVKEIVEAYTPSAAAGFCVGQGAVTLEPSRTEEAGVTFEHTAVTGCNIEFATRSVARPDTATFSGVEEEKDFADSAGGSLTVLRDQRRSAASLQGKEIRLLLSFEDEKPLVRFTWHYPGEAASAVKPAIDLVGAAPGDQKALLEKIWEKLLKSLRPVPLAGGGEVKNVDHPA